MQLLLSPNCWVLALEDSGYSPLRNTRPGNAPYACPLAGMGKERQPGDRAATGARKQLQQRHVLVGDGVHAGHAPEQGGVRSPYPRITVAPLQSRRGVLLLPEPPMPTPTYPWLSMSSIASPTPRAGASCASSQRPALHLPRCDGTTPGGSTAQKTRRSPGPLRSAARAARRPGDVARHPSHPRSVTIALCFGFSDHMTR